MKVNFSKISAKDQALLADFYESETYQAFKRYFIENGQIYIAQSALFATDIERIQCQGRHLILGEIENKLKEINEKETKLRD
jgi:CMP-N-acetylneuraminic acid synthetase